MAVPRPRPYPNAPTPPSEGGRGGNRDQPGANMNPREGSLGKGFRGRELSARREPGSDGWKLGFWVPATPRPRQVREGSDWAGESRTWCQVAGGG